MKRILHITAHLGGGVGKVISSITIYDKKNEHAVLCLEATKNKHFEKLCIDAGIIIYIASDEDVYSLVEKYDILQIEWWHHPMMARFLVEFIMKVKVRLIVWSHISGCNYPSIPIKFIKVPDAFVFTTKYSLENRSWSILDRFWVSENTCVVPSVGSCFSNERIEKSRHKEFNIGYMGFLGYEKMYSKTMEYYTAITDIPCVRFVFIGDINYAKKLKEDIKQAKLDDLVEFTGYVKNIKNELARLDVFSYLLQPEHTGSTENALLEAMAAGVPPVVFKQCVEKYIVKDRVTGCVVQNKEEYVNAMKWLYKNPQARSSLGLNAAAFIRQEYDLLNTIKIYDNIYDMLMEQPKTSHNFSSVFGQKPYEWFLSCYNGSLAEIRGVANGETKASVNQYARYFPEDKELHLLMERNRCK